MKSGLPTFRDQRHVHPLSFLVYLLSAIMLSSSLILQSGELIDYWFDRKIWNFFPETVGNIYTLVLLCAVAFNICNIVVLPILAIVSSIISGKMDHAATGILSTGIFWLCFMQVADQFSL